MDEVEGPLQSDLPPPAVVNPSKLVLRILQYLRLRRRGRHGWMPAWYTFKLKGGEYNDLITLIEREESLWGFVEDKVMYDYSFRTETLSLRSRTLRHGVFLSEVGDEIKRKLRALTDMDNSRSRAFAQEILCIASTTMCFSSDDDSGGFTTRRDPDTSFMHRDARWPGVVIEVAYSQKARELPYMADDYILESYGNIRVVVGLDIGSGTKKATISMWRPTYLLDEQGQVALEAGETLNRQVFRDEFGEPNLSPDAGLKLELRDFAPTCLATGISGSFLIDSATLCQFLSVAELMEENVREDRGFREELPPGTVKRRYVKSPSEEGDSEDE